MLFTDFSEGFPFLAPNIFSSLLHFIGSIHGIIAAASDLHTFILSLYKGGV